MSGITTAEMCRISVAGTLNELSPTLELAARLSAIHITDYEGDRSEERRVGKEGRSRWSPYH